MEIHERSVELVLKRKQNCKIIYDNSNYYVETKDRMFKFNNISDAEYFYKNAQKISVDFLRQFNWEGKIYLEFYPDDLELIIKAIEQFKFFLDKSLYFTDNKNIFKEKSFDCFYLYEYICGMYREYKDKK